MENYDFDYYLIEKDGNYMSPSLMENDDDDDDTDGFDYLYDMELAPENTTSYLTFSPPFPKKPEMVDYHFFEGWQVYSKKIYDVLKTKEIKGLQLVPCIIHSNKGLEYKDYWIANVYQEYAFLDPDKSDREGSINAKGSWAMVNSMVLDKEKVLQVPLEERLLFVVKESCGYMLYHKTVVDLIMSVNPIGLKFIHINDWYNGVQYKQ